MQNDDLISFLQTKVALFSEFESDQLRELIHTSRTATYEDSEALIEFGTPGRFLGVLLKGDASISVMEDTGRHREISRIGPGDIFGEMSLMTGERTVADVVSRGHSAALLIPQAAFLVTVMSHPGAIGHLSRQLTERARAMAYDDQRLRLGRQAEARSSDPHGFSLHCDVPHHLLVINCGSSSLKYSLLDTDRPEKRLDGLFERIGTPDATHVAGDHRQSVVCANHEEAFHQMVTSLTGQEAIRSVDDITVVGHRVVHGGEHFTSATLITEDVLNGIRSLNELAPLHNPVNLKGIEQARSLFRNAFHVAVFDTTFHHTMPPYAYLYGLPYTYYENHGVRRYGFHGQSHAYVSLRAAQFLQKPYNALEIITCHLGSGASVCAVDHGRSVDTSMGFTPSAGLIMGTRCGDVDPGALTFIARKEGLSAADLDAMINRKSGLLGLSGISSDMRELEIAASEGNHRALMAIKAFCYQLRKTIGSSVAAMQGLDAIVFTGGIGENSAKVRSFALQGLDCMGILVDEQKNQAVCRESGPVDISADDSRVRVLVIPTDEALMIARDTLQALEQDTACTLQRSDIDIPLEVSAHHVHLSIADVEALFGPGHPLTPVSELSQPDQFACAEKVDLIGPRGTVANVRVLGPVRSETQVEIAMTEQFRLGIHPPIRESGDLGDTPGVRLAGPAGTVDLKQGVICAMRHIHMSPSDALRLGLRDRYTVRVVVEGDRELVFGDVLVRVSPSFQLAMHIDTDEANAAGIRTGATGHLHSVQSRH